MCTMKLEKKKYQLTVWEIDWLINYSGSDLNTVSVGDRVDRFKQSLRILNHVLLVGFYI